MPKKNLLLMLQTKWNYTHSIKTITMTKLTQRNFGFLLLSLALLLGVVLSMTRESKEEKREKYAAFLHHKAAAMEQPTEAELAEMPKPTHPDKAQMQDYFMTHDPATGIVPKERLMQNYLAVKNQATLKATNDVDLEWQGTSAEMGGRTRAIMWDPNDAAGKKVWAGGVTGGLWYRDDITNDNVEWQPVDDFWSSLNISCITHDPNDPMTFYVGTGESQTALIIYRESSGVGDGIWKSDDGGLSWNLMETTLDFEYVNDIVIRDENGTSVIYAAVVSGIYRGAVHQSEPSDGVFRSMDGGATWEQVLPNMPELDQPYAPADIEMGADGRLYVGTMQNVNIDGGATILYSDEGTPGSWTIFDDYVEIIQNNSQFYIPGRVMMAAAPSDENIVYAAIAAGYTSDFNRYAGRYIIKSTDKGESWNPIDIPDNDWSTLAWHAFIIKVDPNDPQSVFTGGLDMWKTENSGNSWYHISDWSLMYYGGGDDYIHADQHAIAFKPGSSTEFICGSDGGVFYTTSATNTYPVFEQKNQGYNTLQFYTCDIVPDPGNPLYVGGLQDNGTLLYQNQPLSINNMIDGGDGAYCFFDDAEQILITSVYYNDYTVFYNWNYYDDFDDNSGIFINPADFDTQNNILYANRVNFTGGYTNQLLRVDGIPFNIDMDPLPLQTGTNVYFSHIKVSPYAPAGTSTLFIGTQTGQVFRVGNAQSYQLDLTEITGEDFPLAYVSSIAVGQSEDVLLVTFSNYGVESVWQTIDGGESWTNVEGNLPDIPIRWALYHPANDEQVMLATELGIWTTNWLSAEDVVWNQNAAGMANVRVDMLSLRESDNTVLAATHGRGLFTALFPLDPTISVPERQSEVLSVFPNPSQGVINLRLDAQAIPNTVAVLDIAGKQVMKLNTHGQSLQSFDLSHLPKGSYILKADIGGKIRTEKIILKY